MSSIPATPFCGAGLRPCDRDYPKKDVIRGKPHAAGGDRCEGDWNPPDGTGNSQWIEKKDAESALYWLLAMTDSVIVGCGQAVVRCYQHRQRPPSHPRRRPQYAADAEAKPAANAMLAKLWLAQRQRNWLGWRREGLAPARRRKLLRTVDSLFPRPLSQFGFLRSEELHMQTEQNIANI